ncbi:unnamed protein product [Toxocara canis]|uniref:Adenomatous polyposis coli protein n=1 Tax=Toxocara canis TaxID=6265 RepID=A0A183ULH2_TOXCA|nr:unnamed protein product [Toxocara canis]
MSSLKLSRFALVVEQCEFDCILLSNIVDVNCHRCSGTKQTKTLRMQLRTDDDKGDTTKRNDNSSQTTTTTTPPTMKVVIEHVYGAPSAQHVLTNDAASPPALNPPTKLACPTGTHPTSSASCNIPKRTCSAKPMPPAKPDYLRTTVANIRTASLEAPRKACGGTRSLLSKKGVCQAAFANPSSSSEQNEEQRSSSVVSAPPNSITGDDVQKSANSARDSVGASACGRCTGIGLTELEGDLCSKAAQALSTKQAFRSAAHSSEEIKKPTVKPPPPPKLTASPRAEMTQSSDGGQKSSTRAQSTSPFVQQPTSEVEMASMALSNVEVTHTEVTSPASSNSGDLYQMMPSSVETKDDREQTKSPRFQRYIDGDEIPRVPSIPPPSPPKLPPHNSLDDDDLYEEIEQVISFRLLLYLYASNQAGQVCSRDTQTSVLLLNLVLAALRRLSFRDIAHPIAHAPGFRLLINSVCVDLPENPV